MSGFAFVCIGVGGGMPRLIVGANDGLVLL